MPTYKNETDRYISHIDRHSGARWDFAPGEEKVVDFYLDEPLETGIVIVDENPIPNPIAGFQTISGNQGDTVEVPIPSDEIDYYGTYDISVKIDTGKVELAFNSPLVAKKTEIKAGEVWRGQVHKRHIKKIIFSILEDSTSGKIEFFKLD